MKMNNSAGMAGMGKWFFGTNEQSLLKVFRNGFDFSDRPSRTSFV
jgi:hypothetical protein